MNRKIRINKFLASAGLGSRRYCENLVREGRVRVNGVAISELAKYIDIESDGVEVDGVPIEWQARTKILVLNKPRGVLSSVRDDFGRKTVIDLAREKGYEDRLFPVGRLDMDTSGMLLLTNDGELSYRLTHPSYKIEKTYVATVQGSVDDEKIRAVESGVDIGGVVTSPCRVTLLARSDETSTLEIRLNEGRKRQIRRMFSSIDHEVIELRRVAIGRLEFKDLEPGEMRQLTEEEERELREQTNLS